MRNLILAEAQLWTIKRSYTDKARQIVVNIVMQTCWDLSLIQDRIDLVSYARTRLVAPTAAIHIHTAVHTSILIL